MIANTCASSCLIACNRTSGCAAAHALLLRRSRPIHRGLPIVCGRRPAPDCNPFCSSSRTAAAFCLAAAASPGSPRGGSPDGPPQAIHMDAMQQKPDPTGERIPSPKSLCKAQNGAVNKNANRFHDFGRHFCVCGLCQWNDGAVLTGTAPFCRVNRRPAPPPRTGTAAPGTGCCPAAWGFCCGSRRRSAQCTCAAPRGSAAARRPRPARSPCG